MSDPTLTDRKDSQALTATASTEEVSETCIVTYDENLLERARIQWRFGDWDSLCKLCREAMQHHPERAKLALLAAAGMLQIGNIVQAKLFITLARDWGISKKLLTQVLISGVHNTLGRCYLGTGEDKRALNHFEDAIILVQPSANKNLYGEARAVRQAAQLGLLPQAARLVGSQLKAANKGCGSVLSRIAILETEIELLNQELSLAQQRQQLFIQKAGQKEEFSFGSDEWKAQLIKKSVSQLGQDLWVLEKTNYKLGGFFVEFGASDGVLLSNTWILEKEFYWKGICIEPNPKFFKKLQKNRGCITSNHCISGKTGEIVEFIFADVYGGIIKYADIDTHSKKRGIYSKAGHIAALDTISLNDFLINHQAPKVIDYISIDTEGSEFEILRSFPFDKWDVRLLTVEHNYTENRKDIRELLERYGYRCREEKFDDWYEKIVK